MNARLSLIFLFIPWIAFTQEGNFKWQNPLPQGNDLNGCCCAAGHIAWAAGNGGTIIKSTDKGVTWALQNSGVSNRLGGIFFLDSLRGWACGDQTMLHTLDGGNTWTAQTIPDSCYLNDIQFVDENTGWAVGDHWKILRTLNGGQNWTDFGFYTPNALLSVCFADSQNGYAVGAGGSLLMTHNGGNSWIQSQAFGENYYLSSVFFITADTGWICGFYNGFPGMSYMILKTVNAGLSWTPYPTDNHSTNDIWFSDPLHGYIASISSTLETTDGGMNWNHHRWIEDEAIIFNAIAFFDENTGLCAGESSAILRKPANPDTVWEFSSPGNTQYLRDIEFVSDQHGWAVGSYNTILHTIDGGNTWQPYPPGDTFDFNYWLSVEFPDPQHGWICGSGGTILRTRDGGLSWENYTATPFLDLYSLFFLDSNYGWVVGEGDIRLKTVDGGLTWNGFPSYMWSYTNDVFFIDPMTGWVVGEDGFINKTTNGGANWVMQYAGTTSTLNSIWFVDAMNGWIVGDDAVVLHTLNGGESWSLVPVPAENYLFDVFFHNDAVGWITGYNGQILKTVDGGQNWYAELIITDQSLNAMSFPDLNTGWICGSEGTILVYDPLNPISIREKPVYPGKGLTIYPNPAHTAIHLQIETIPFEKVKIYTAAGNLLYEEFLDRDRQKSMVRINTTMFPPGIYILEAINDHHIDYEKFIIY